MHDYAASNDRAARRRILSEFQSYNLEFDADRETMMRVVNVPPLNANRKAFPFIYFDLKYNEVGNGKVI